MGPEKLHLFQIYLYIHTFNFVLVLQPVFTYPLRPLDQLTRFLFSGVMGLSKNFHLVVIGGKLYEQKHNR